MVGPHEPIEPLQTARTRVFQIRDVDTDKLYCAYMRIIALLDTRILPDPLQDDMYLFSMTVWQELQTRPEIDEVKSRYTA